MSWSLRWAVGYHQTIIFIGTHVQTFSNDLEKSIYTQFEHARKVTINNYAHEKSVSLPYILFLQSHYYFYDHYNFKDQQMTELIDYIKASI